MSASREELLQPTLTQNTPPSAPYSIQTTLFTGFFGGPLAAIFILAANSMRLRRLRQDAAALLAMLAFVAIGGWVLHETAHGLIAQEWLEASFGKSHLRFVYRLAALMIVGGGYLLHRREQRNAELVGLVRPNGWIAGTFCAVLGFALMIACVAALTKV